MRHGGLRIDGVKAGVVVHVRGKVAQGSQIGETRKKAGDSCQGGNRQVLNDAPVLLKLRQCIHLLTCSENSTPCKKYPGFLRFPSSWPSVCSPIIKVAPLLSLLLIPTCIC